MCGKYYYASINNHKDIIDMNPTDSIPVYLSYQNRIILTRLHWGYELPTKELIINARSETIEEKKIFKEDFQERRCIIPANGFYQKDQAGHMIAFETNTKQIIYMAGIYHHKNVVILTTSPNDTVRSIHDRMPLMIPKTSVKDWLDDQNKAHQLLQYQMNDLKIASGHIQQTLFI